MVFVTGFSRLRYVISRVFTGLYRLQAQRGQVKLVNSDRQLGIVALNHPTLTEVYDIGIKELQALKDQLIEDEGGAHSVNGSPSLGSRMGAGGVQVV